MTNIEQDKEINKLIGEFKRLYGNEVLHSHIKQFMENHKRSDYKKATILFEVIGDIYKISKNELFAFRDRDNTTIKIIIVYLLKISTQLKNEQICDLVHIKLRTLRSYMSTAKFGLQNDADFKRQYETVKKAYNNTGFVNLY